MIRYIFWDSDNTLLNTAKHHWRKHFETLKTLGIHLDNVHREAVYTHNGSQNWAWMRKDLGLELPEQDYLDLIDTWFFDHIEEIEIRAGISEAIQIFKDAGLAQAVVSNGRKKSVMAAQNAKGLTPHFEFILCNEDYEGRKPDPAPYLVALEKMNTRKGLSVSPAQCLAIEDDPKGVASARAAGMLVIDRPPIDEDTKAFIQKCKTYL
jgi:HAD superfamily hydrolase (TIGR01509 family)